MPKSDAISSRKDSASILAVGRDDTKLANGVDATIDDDDRADDSDELTRRGVLVEAHEGGA